MEIHLAKEDGDSFSEKVVSKTEQSQIKINGQTTFLDIERDTGIPTGKIIKTPRLAADTPVNERLSHLRKRFPFTVQEARDGVATLLKKGVK